MQIKIGLFSLNYIDLNQHSLNILQCSNIDNSVNGIENFKEKLDLPVISLSIIKKCNAVMVLAVWENRYKSEEFIEKIIDTWINLSGYNYLGDNVSRYYDEAAIKYLLESTEGLYSVVLGDSQVYSQIKSDLTCALKVFAKDRIIKAILKKTKLINKAVRTRTGFHSGYVSLERIACDLIVKKKIKSKKVAVIGYGKSGRLVSQILNKEFGHKILVANRTLVNVEEPYCDEFVELTDFEKLKKIECIVLTIENVEATNDYCKKLFSAFSNSAKVPKLVVDLSTPSLSECHTKDVLFCTINIKELSRYSKLNLDYRRTNIPAVEGIIRDALPSLMRNIIGDQNARNR